MPEHFRPGDALNADDLCLLITENSTPYAAVQIADQHDRIVASKVSIISHLGDTRVVCLVALRKIEQATSIGEPAHIAADALATVKAMDAAFRSQPVPEAAVMGPSLFSALKRLMAACECVRPIRGDVSFDTVKDTRRAIEFMAAVEEARAALSKVEGN